MGTAVVRTRKSDAFTLIELLVVIAIISILAAFLFPVFAQVRERARETACLSNVKQIALADYMYLQDYDETFWSTPEYNPSPGNKLYYFDSWSDILMPYIKNTQVFNCPSNSDQIVWDPWYKYPAVPVGSAANFGSPTAYRVTYGFADLGPHADQMGTWQLSRLQSPAQIALLTDAVYSWNYPACEYDPEKAAGVGSWYFARGINFFDFEGKARHFNGCNFSYADGHAKWSTFAGSTIPGAPDWIYSYYPQARVKDDDCNPATAN